MQLRPLRQAAGRVREARPAPPPGAPCVWGVRGAFGASRVGSTVRREIVRRPGGGARAQTRRALAELNRRAVLAFRHWMHPESVASE